MFAALSNPSPPPSSSYDTHLFYLAQMDIATTLLEYGAETNCESKAGFTPLHLAAQEGHSDMTTLLIEHMADVNQKAKVQDAATADGVDRNGREAGVCVGGGGEGGGMVSGVANASSWDLA